MQYYNLMICSLFQQLQFSEVLVKWRQFFNFLAAQQGQSEMTVLDQKLDLEQLKVCLAFSKSNAGSWFLVFFLTCSCFLLTCYINHDFKCHVVKQSAAMYVFKSLKYFLVGKFD